ncbi:F0F1 ATP synthase subunit A [Nocardioides panacisoli]|uniref:F0F1 ATP synthase subunit A n=1 Tax=Nocardioides panacisoli TaxID=627624 RepID=UPI001C6355C4|nr:F0F1 ATP synthase subunit A [Nocardioides panacisoli]QYJ05619.1 F0F1 ATP synthase subunit A [Nocardioides panacisoli]
MSVTAAEEFIAPGPGLFELPPIVWEITKPMVLLTLSAVIVIGVMHLASRQAAVVPGRLQFAGEQAYDFVRNSIARDNIGADHYMKFVPYLFGLFMFIIINNYYGIVPLLQFPTFSRIGYIIPMALVSWLVFIGAGMWRHGALGYFKHATVPSGVPPWILVLLVPLEFLSNIVVRPFTLTLRLFGNMFAGHLLLALFATGGAYLLTSGNVLYAATGVLAFVMGVLVGFLEIIVMFLQAYVFTLLSAMYIGEAIAEDH